VGLVEDYAMEAKEWEFATPNGGARSADDDVKRSGILHYGLLLATVGDTNLQFRSEFLEFVFPSTDQGARNENKSSLQVDDLKRICRTPSVVK
jgi:hypothetical protein